MPIAELGTVIATLVRVGAKAGVEKAKRREAIIKALKTLKLAHEPPPAADFDVVYTYSLVEFGIDKPQSVLDFFRNEFIRNAFEQSFTSGDWSILNQEAEGIIDWSQEVGRLGAIDYDPRREFAAFSLVFNQVIDRTRTAVEIRQERKLDDIHDRISNLIGSVDKLDTKQIRELYERSQANDLAATSSRTWNVPHLRNPHFMERDNVLKDIQSRLSTGFPIALTGLGGVGKTQLAVEYAFRHRPDYEHVWWIRSEDSTTLAADYAQIATQFGLPEREEPDQTIIFATVFHWLQQHGSWLLIFDNASDPGDIRPFLPKGGTGHVLITSRNPSWGGLATPLSVKGFKSGQARRFLLERSGQADPTAASQLAQELGFLPLALEQASAYIEARSIPIADYLALFREHHLKILGRSRPATDYPATVETTWSLSFEQVQQEVPAATDLLNLCAFLAPDDIPLPMLRAGGAYLQEPLAGIVVDSLELEDAIAALRRYSLVERVSDALSVHRIVQLVVRNQLGESKIRLTIEDLLRLVADVYPASPTQVSSWPVCARLLPHAVTLLRAADEEHVSHAAAVRLMIRVGTYFYARGRYAAAYVWLQRALQLADTPIGLDPDELATCLINLGSTLRQVTDFRRARECFERALAIYQHDERFGERSPEVGRCLSNLGGVAREVGDLSAAMDYFERALSIDQERYGSDHPEVATDLNNIGGVLLRQGDEQEALTHFRSALDIAVRFYGERSEEIVVYLTNVGVALLDLGYLQEAYQYLQPAVDIAEERYGDDHIQFASSLNALGRLYQELGEVDEAILRFERVVAITEAAYGRNSMRVATYLSNLAGALHQKGELDRARALFEAATEAMEVAINADPLDHATFLSHLSDVYRDLGMMDQAQVSLEHSLTLAESEGELGRGAVSKSLNKLGGLLYGENDLQAAKDYFQRALKVTEETYGQNHHGVSICAANLGGVLQDLGERQQAEHFFSLALQIARSLPDFGSTRYPQNLRELERVAAICKRIATLRTEDGRLHGAAESLAKLLEIEQRLGNRGEEVQTFYWLGAMTAALGQEELGVRLMAMGFSIAGAPRAQNIEELRESLLSNAAQLGYDHEQINNMLPEVAEAYNRDRGRELVKLALADEVDGPGE